MKRTIMGLSLMLMACAPLAAQTAAPTDSAKAEQKPKFSIKPTGRILMDGALYFGDRDREFVDGVAIPDVRIGVKAGYGKWKAKVDIGYSYGKVSLKDLFVEYDFNEHNLLRAGNFVHQFGLQSATSSSMKVTMEEPTSNEIFNNPRLIGLMYVFDKGNYFATASAHVESDALKYTSNQLGKTGYGFMSHLVYRPMHETGRVVQVGFSGGFATPRYNSEADLNHKSFVLSANFPTRVSKVTALEAIVPDAKNLFKFTPEFLGCYGPVALETQYYYLQINRNNSLHRYNASGFYAFVRGLVLGGDYEYSHADAGLATPRPRSLECVVGYNYTDMVDRNAGVYGGRLNDASVTFNYYINKYMIARLRYSYTNAKSRAGMPDQHVNTIQARFQIIF